MSSGWWCRRVLLQMEIAMKGSRMRKGTGSSLHGVWFVSGLQFGTCCCCCCQGKTCLGCKISQGSIRGVGNLVGPKDAFLGILLVIAIVVDDVVVETVLDAVQWMIGKKSTRRTQIQMTPSRRHRYRHRQFVDATSTRN